MKKTFLLQLGLFIFAILLQADGYGQKKEKSDVKKVNLLPVYLVYSGLPEDTALNKMVMEAFKRHKVKIITYKEFNQTNDDEVRRIETKFRARANEFGSEREIREAIEKEQRFVSNMLTINFTFQKTNMDSVTVTGASWRAVPYPPNISSPRTSGDIKTELESTCCNPQDNIFAIIDKILFSKWLR